jgi:ferredoxin
MSDVFNNLEILLDTPGPRPKIAPTGAHGASKKIYGPKHAAGYNVQDIRHDARFRKVALMPASYKISVTDAGEATCYEGERALVALERAQGFGRLKNLPCKLPVGCRRGGCGVCRVRVLSGEYRSDTMSRAHISVEDEEAGLVLSCAIYPLTDIELRVEPPPFVKKAITAGTVTTSQET